ncbi:hypothetical protein PIROE2DRAFT_9694 [Piromyces sp. E2]|nr:hypothetical protein PIROE2DRAFT_9694 [Piromyces sp. E2]|eukprot:OUM63686.1 hypothetical protein PIROE2DRAFT_9694 [Piromyces sp. E2]
MKKKGFFQLDSLKLLILRKELQCTSYTRYVGLQINTFFLLLLVNIIMSNEEEEKKAERLRCTSFPRHGGCIN